MCKYWVLPALTLVGKGPSSNGSRAQPSAKCLGSGGFLVTPICAASVRHRALCCRQARGLSTDVSPDVGKEGGANDIVGEKVPNAGKAVTPLRHILPVDDKLLTMQC